MNLKEYKNKLMQDPKFKKEYEKVDLAFEISKMIIELRIKKGITQKKLAELLGTKQPSIARAENGVMLPSLSFLDSIAKALGTYLLPPRFACMVSAIDITNADSGNYVQQETYVHIFNKNTKDVFVYKEAQVYA